MTNIFGKVYQSDLEVLKDLPKGSILVFLALSQYANKKRECWPSQASLADAVGMSSRGVQKALKVLEMKGLITVRRLGHRKPNVYSLKNPDTNFLVSDTNFSTSDTNCTVRTNRPIRTDQLNILEGPSPSSSSYDDEFLSLFSSWKENDQTAWKSSDPLKDWKEVVTFAAPELDISMELKVIDCWIRKELINQSGKVWTGRIWKAKMKRWLKSQTKRSAFPLHLKPFQGRTIPASQPKKEEKIPDWVVPSEAPRMPSELQPILDSLRIHRIHWLESVSIYNREWSSYQLEPETMNWLIANKHNGSLSEDERTVYLGVHSLFSQRS